MDPGGLAAVHAEHRSVVADDGPVGGQVHVVLALENAVKYYTKPATGSWSGVTISSHGASSAVIRRDPDGGRLFAAYTRLTPDFDLGGIYGLTKP